MRWGPTQDLRTLTARTTGTHQVIGAFGWEFASRWKLTAGYRILGWEFEADGIRNDLRLSGVMFGVAASF